MYYNIIIWSRDYGDLKKLNEDFELNTILGNTYANN